MIRRNKSFAELEQIKERNETERQEFLKTLKPMMVFDVWSCDDESQFSPVCGSHLIFSGDELEDASGMILETVCDAGELFVLLPKEL